MYTAVILLCTQALLCEPYVDPKVYETHDSCKEAGNIIYQELITAASDTDLIGGDCLESQAPLTKEQAKALVEQRLFGDLIKKGSI